MKKFLLNFLCQLTVLIAFGQCDHMPVIDPPGNITLCPGESITLATQDWYTNYQWSQNGIPITGATSSSLTVNEFGFYLVFADSAGCTGVSQNTLVDYWVFLPPAIASDGIGLYCEGDSTILSNAFGQYAMYQWFDNGVEIPGAMEETLTVFEPGSFTLSVYPFECPSIELNNGVSVNINFVAPVIPNVSWDGTELTADSGSDFQWFLNGTPINGAMGINYTPTETGTYTVSVTDANGCFAVSDGVMVIISGLDDLVKTYLEVIPTNGAIRFEVLKNSLFSHAIIYNVLGEKIGMVSLYENSIWNYTQAPGLFIIRVFDQTGGETSMKVYLSKG